MPRHPRTIIMALLAVIAFAGCGENTVTQSSLTIEATNETGTPQNITFSAWRGPGDPEYQTAIFLDPYAYRHINSVADLDVGVPTRFEVVRFGGIRATSMYTPSSPATRCMVVARATDLQILCSGE